jgi:hypothetical protein
MTQPTTQPTSPKAPKSGAALNTRGSKPAAPRNEAFDKEVDEELQREQLSQLWERYSGYILAGAVALVLGVGAYKMIESRRQATAEAQGAAYIAGIKQLTSGKVDEGAAALAAVGKSGSGFGSVARLRLAAADVATGKTAEAVAKYEAFAKDRSVDPVLADFARLQTAMLTIDTASWDDMQGRLTPLAADSNAWRFSAKELLGMAALKAGQTEAARTQFEKLIGDPAVPAGIAERARIMMGSIVATDLAAKGTLAPPAAAGATPVAPSVPPVAAPAATPVPPVKTSPAGAATKK